MDVLYFICIIGAYFLGRKDQRDQAKKEETKALANRQMDYLKKRGLW